MTQLVPDSWTSVTSGVNFAFVNEAFVATGPDGRRWLRAEDELARAEAEAARAESEAARADRAEAEAARLREELDRLRAAASE